MKKICLKSNWPSYLSFSLDFKKALFWNTKRVDNVNLRKSSRKILTNTSYWILIKWHPRRLVGGKGGTKSFSFFQSSVSLYLILPRLMEDSSLVSVSITLLRVMYWMVWNIDLIQLQYDWSLDWNIIKTVFVALVKCEVNLRHRTLE